MRVYEKNIYVEFVKKINIHLVGHHSKKVEKNWPKRVQIIDDDNNTAHNTRPGS